MPIWPEHESCPHASNVAGDGAWACPDTGFPLAHFVPEKPVRWWRTDDRRPSAIAVDGDHALLAGGYGEEGNQLTLVHLPGDGIGERAPAFATWAMPLRRLPPPANEWAPVWHHPSLLSGRGGTIHLIDDAVWFRWRVQDLVATK